MAAILASAACVGTAGGRGVGADARLTPDELRRGFAELCARLHYRAVKVEVDQSEYPFVVYGMLEGRCDYRDMQEELRSMPGFVYGGSVTAKTPDAPVTFFAINLTSVPGASERLMARMQQLVFAQQ